MATKKLTPKQVSYREKLKNPKWQKKRLEIFERDSYCCNSCYDDKAELHVHHLKYNDCDPWDIDNDYLITLCHKCHAFETDNYKMYCDRLMDTLKQNHLLSWHIFMLDKAFSSKNHHLSDRTELMSLWYAMTDSDTWMRLNKGNDRCTAIAFPEIFKRSKNKLNKK